MNIVGSKQRFTVEEVSWAVVKQQLQVFRV